MNSIFIYILEYKNFYNLISKYFAVCLRQGSRKQYDIIIQSCCFVFLSFFYYFLEFVPSVIRNINKQVEIFENRRNEILILFTVSYKNK